MLGKFCEKLRRGAKKGISEKEDHSFYTASLSAKIKHLILGG